MLFWGTPYMGPAQNNIYNSEPPKINANKYRRIINAFLSTNALISIGAALRSADNRKARQRQRKRGHN